ncbi:MAG: hypothetical protein R6W90_06850 [Ignavibacteriaceae bacterium]
MFKKSLFAKESTRDSGGEIRCANAAANVYITDSTRSTAAMYMIVWLELRLAAI